MTWDPATYGRYAGPRDRPFHELVSRIDAQPRHVVDLGCGDGHLTRVLAERWPDADVLGIDSSPEMLSGAPRDVPRLRFEAGDLATWGSPRPVDVIVSNAALHWVPDHPHLLERLARSLAPGGVLAVQVPYNFDAPSHRIVRAVAARPEWSDRFEGLGAVHVLPPDGYLRVLHGLGLTADLWATTYHQVLAGQDAVLRWLEGTALRPYLARLGPDDAPTFLRALAQALQDAYPPQGDGVVFPFTRLFFVAAKHRASTPSKPPEA